MAITTPDLPYCFPGDESGLLFYNWKARAECGAMKILQNTGLNKSLCSIHSEYWLICLKSNGKPLHKKEKRREGAGKC
jgi:ADP-dependent phosphofructokinase/glucokinase